jgi:adenosine deaminase
VLKCIEDFGRAEMHTYLLLSIDRKNTIDEADQVVDLAIKYQSRGVVGIDLCGNPSKKLESDLGAAFEKARKASLKNTLHFAETSTTGADTELRKLLTYEPSRLGHVIHVSESIKEEIVARKLGLELCLSCNVLAGLTSGSISDHHFGYWKDKGCPVILCVSRFKKNMLTRLLTYVRRMTWEYSVARCQTSICLRQNISIWAGKRLLIFAGALFQLFSGARKSKRGCKSIFEWRRRVYRVE